MTDRDQGQNGKYGREGAEEPQNPCLQHIVPHSTCPMQRQTTQSAPAPCKRQTTQLPHLA